MVRTIPKPSATSRVMETMSPHFALPINKRGSDGAHSVSNTSTNPNAIAIVLSKYRKNTGILDVVDSAYVRAHKVARIPARATTPRASTNWYIRVQCGGKEVPTAMINRILATGK